MFKALRNTFLTINKTHGTEIAPLCLHFTSYNKGMLLQTIPTNTFLPLICRPTQNSVPEPTFPYYFEMYQVPAKSSAKAVSLTLPCVTETNLHIIGNIPKALMGIAIGSLYKVPSTDWTSKPPLKNNLATFTQQDKYFQQKTLLPRRFTAGRVYLFLCICLVFLLLMQQ